MGAFLRKVIGRHRRIFLGLLLVSLSAGFLPTFSRAQLISYPTGTLLRCGDATTIYYIGADNERHAFADAVTYYSWYRNFSGVQTVPSNVCDSYALGQDVTIRPGTFLVKIGNTAATYAVAAPNVLRHVTTEDIAQTLYGAGWSTSQPAGSLYVLPPSLAGQYRIGDPITDVNDYNREVERSSCPTISICYRFGAGTRVGVRTLVSVLSRSIPLSALQQPIPPAVQRPLPTAPLRIPRPAYVPLIGIDFNVLFPLPILQPPITPVVDVTSTPIIIPPTPSTPSRASLANSMSPLGTNVSEVSERSTEWAFIDAFKHAGPWVSLAGSSGVPDNRPIDIDPNGWVRSLFTGQHVRAIIFDESIAGQYPSGEYIILYEGVGTMVYSGNAVKNQALSKPGRDVVNVDANRGGFFLTIEYTNPTNYIKNIRVIVPGGVCSNDAFASCVTNNSCSNGATCVQFEDIYETQIFHPLFLQQLEQYKTIRFANWMTGASQMSTGRLSWNSRPRIESARWTTQAGGVPVEIMVALANKLQAHPWFTLPHTATNDYMRGFATVVRDRLSTSLRSYIEYSHEVWNQDLPQGQYATTQGQILGLGSNPLEARLRYYVERSLAMFRIWSDTFGGTKNIVRVLSTQATNQWMSNQIMEWQAAYRQADALAIAPYIGYNMSYSGRDRLAQMENLSLDDFFARLQGSELSGITDAIRAHSVNARRHNLDLISYGGGTYLVEPGATPSQNNSTLNALFTAASRDERMAAVYTSLLNTWREFGGKLFVHYTNTAPASIAGRFGALEATNQNPFPPKYRTLMNFIRMNPQWWDEKGGLSVDGASNMPPAVILTAPVAGSSLGVGSSVVLLAAASDSDNGIDKVEFYANSMKVGESNTNPYTIVWSGMPAGVYTLFARAIDRVGLATTSTPVRIRVDVSAPVVSGSPVTQGVAATGGDEFLQATALQDFNILSGTRYETLDVNETTPGHLTIIPTAIAYNAWFSDEKPAPFVYKTITGNFIVETDVNVTRRGEIGVAYDGSLAPRGQGNSAGILLRDPSSVSPGLQNWLLYGIGYQMTGIARGVKIARPNPGAASFTSIVHNVSSPVDLHSGKLRICRVGDTFYLYHKLPNESVWVEESYTSATGLFGSALFDGVQGIPSSVYGTPMRYLRPDLPRTIQIGLAAENFGVPFDTRAEFDYIRFAIPNVPSDCLMDLPPVDSNIPINSAPAVVVTSPVNGTLFTAGNNLSIAATAVDSDGHISVVEFYQGSVKIGESVNSPYQITWMNVPVGVYSITAKVFDDHGTATISDPITVTVSNPSSQTETTNSSGVSSDPLTELGDEFTDASTLSNWMTAYTLPITTIDINTTIQGKLAVIPGDLSSVDARRRAWHGGAVAPFLYKSVTGNFIVETLVNAHKTGDTSQAPAGYYATAGILLYNPNSTDPLTTSNGQQWFMYATGHVEYPTRDVVGTMRMSTVNSASIISKEIAGHELILRACRIDNTLYFFRKEIGDPVWTPDPALDTNRAYVRNDFPETLQVGLVANAYYGVSDITAEFDYIRFGTPTTVADCTSTISSVEG